MGQLSRSYLQPAFRFGTLGGIVTIIGIYTFYALGTKAFANPIYGLVIFGLLFLVNTAMAIGAGITYKKQNGGVIPFQDAVLQTFTTLGIIIVIYHTFYFLLLNVIDPGLVDQLATIHLEKLNNLKETGAINQETYEEQRTITENSELTILNTLGLTFIWLALGFLLALILSAILRKEPKGGEDGA